MVSEKSNQIKTPLKQAVLILVPEKENHRNTNQPFHYFPINNYENDHVLKKPFTVKCLLAKQFMCPDFESQKSSYLKTLLPPHPQPTHPKCWHSVLFKFWFAR